MDPRVREDDGLQIPSFLRAHVIPVRPASFLRRQESIPHQALISLAVIWYLKSSGA